MTKKDFESIAHAVRITRTIIDESPSQTTEAVNIRLTSLATIEIVAEALVFELNTTNPRFDRTRFLTACGIPTVEQ